MSSLRLQMQSPQRSCHPLKRRSAASTPERVGMYAWSQNLWMRQRIWNTHARTSIPYTHTHRALKFLFQGYCIIACITVCRTATHCTGQLGGLVFSKTHCSTETLVRIKSHLLMCVCEKVCVSMCVLYACLCVSRCLA